jgi:hypothetical protein
MPANAFIGKTEPPGDTEIATALGPAKATWDQLLSELARDHDINLLEWKCYSTKRGWSLRAQRKQRTIVWLAPSDGCFTAALILGAKAMQAARQTELPQSVVAAMNEAPKYPEGTGVRLVVKSPSDVEAIKKLAAIKVAN